MVKLTCPRPTSRGHGTCWDLSSGCTIRIPNWVPLYHGPICGHLLSLRSILYEVTLIFLNFLIYTRMKKIGNIFSDAKKTVKPVAWNKKLNKTKNLILKWVNQHIHFEMVSLKMIQNTFFTLRLSWIHFGLYLIGHRKRNMSTNKRISPFKKPFDCIIFVSAFKIIF